MSEAVEIRNHLQRALAMTEQVLAGPVTPDEVKALLERRGPLLAEAFGARDSGAPWGEQEAALAEQLMASDREIVEALWTPRKDAFVWLRDRYEKVAVEMPHVTQLLGT